MPNRPTLAALVAIMVGCAAPAAAAQTAPVLASAPSAMAGATDLAPLRRVTTSAGASSPTATLGLHGEDRAGTTRPATSRLAGRSRYETAVAVAGQIPRSRGVLIVRGDRPLDAVARVVQRRVVLPIPASGPIPTAVRREFGRRAPSDIVVAGTPSSLPDKQVRALVGKATFTRDTRSVVAASAESGAEYRGSDDTIAFVGHTYVVGTGVVAEAAAATALAPNPVVVLPPRGSASAEGVNAGVQLVWGGPFTRIGGVTRARVAEFVNGPARPGTTTAPVDARTTLNGADRYVTSANIALQAYPAGARTVYLADGRGLDVAFAGRLDGPVLLVPPGTKLPAATRAALQQLKPTRLVALGDTGVVSDGMLTAAATATPARQQNKATAAVAHCVGTADGAVLCQKPTAAPHAWGDLTGPADRQAFTEIGRLTGAITSMVRLQDRVCALSSTGTVGCTPPDSDRVATSGLTTPRGLEKDIARIDDGYDTLNAVTRDGRALTLYPDTAAAVTEVKEAGTNVVQMVGDPSQTCILTTAGQVRCWSRWLGVGQKTDAMYTPTTVSGLPEGITDIGVWGDTFRMRTTDGSLYTAPVDDLPALAGGKPVKAAFRVVGGVPLDGCLPEDPSPAHLRCLDPYGSGKTMTTHRAAGPLAPGQSLQMAWGPLSQLLIALADGRVQLASDLPSLSDPASVPDRFVLGFGG